MALGHRALDLTLMTELRHTTSEDFAVLVLTLPQKKKSAVRRFLYTGWFKYDRDKL
jgi:hypothetical protein